MSTGKYLKPGYLSLVFAIFGIVISASVAKADLYGVSDGKTSEEIVLNVKGMTCGACENAVKSALLECKGVKDAKVSHVEGKAVVKVEGGEAKAGELIEAVEKKGFSASEG